VCFQERTNNQLLIRNGTTKPADRMTIDGKSMVMRDFATPPPAERGGGSTFGGLTEKSACFQ